jgi:hypothetical protein
MVLTRRCVFLCISACFWVLVVVLLPCFFFHACSGVKPHHFRDGTTGNSSSNNNNSGTNDSCFIIYDRKTAGREIYIILMAQDANDRDHWMSAIKTASRLPAVDARLKEDSKHCDHVREQIEQCQDKTEYLSALTSLLSPLRSNHNNHNNHNSNISSITNSSSSNGRVRVPMAWLRKVKNNIATIRNDMTMDQAIKDLLRDMFEIDHVLHRGNAGLVSIIGTLAGNIMDAAQHANIANFSAANALTFAREVLYNANRTQFGGDAYEAVDLICCNEGLVFATPSDQVAAPIQIQVTTNAGNGNNDDNRGRYGSDDDEEDNEDRHVYLSVVVTADMVFKINDMDPQDGDGMMVWTKVLAKFERYFNKKTYKERPQCCCLWCCSGLILSVVLFFFFSLLLCFFYQVICLGWGSCCCFRFGCNLVFTLVAYPFVIYNTIVGVA